MEIPSKSKFPLWLKIAVVVVLIAIIAGFSNEGYKYIKKQEKAFKTQISTLEADKETLKNELLESDKRFENLNVKENDFYNEYIYEYNRRRKAEKALDDIRYLVFDKQYLDSLAKHIEYR